MKARGLVPVVVVVMVLGVATAGAADRYVWDFTSISVVPTVDHGPPVMVDFDVRAWTMGGTTIWPTYASDQVMMWASVWNTSGGASSMTYATRTAPRLFQHTFSFMLPGEGSYWYMAAASYSPYNYYTYMYGAFYTRAGIPSLGTTGMFLLGLLLAGAGVILLRRS